MPVSWTPENERKLLLKIIHLVSNKDIDAEDIAACVPGATPRAIKEHLYVLRKEAKAVFSVEAGVRDGKKKEEEGKDEKKKEGVKDGKNKKEGVQSEGMKGEGEGEGEVKKGRKRKAGGDVEGAGVGEGVEVKKKKSGKGKRGGRETEGNGDGEVA